MADEDIVHLNVPYEESVRYDSNFIRAAVCEFRYPTLLELEENPPVKLQRLLRKRYPHYSRKRGVSVGDAGVAPLGHRYQFESRSRDWTISVRASAVSLETSRYTEFEEFLDRVNELLSSAKNLLDTDFFTRVGLRYINVVSIDDSVLEGWINAKLISALLTNELGVLSQFNTELRGFLSNGQIYF
jgi:uncharacterized protein (TIGR04255 family)